MGLYDRDYYREKHKKISSKQGNSNNCPIQPVKVRATFKHFVSSIILLGALFYWGSVFLDKIKVNKTIGSESIIKIPSFASPKTPDLIPGGIVLQADRNGHFRGTALINNVSMPFMIDTGATQTVIPTSMAVAAGLPFGRSIQSDTAGGQVLEQMTHIDSLRIGSAVINNLDAGINQHLKEVLIGMNTLKYFHITQSVNKLTLVAFTDPNQIAAIENQLSPQISPQTEPQRQSLSLDQPHKNAKKTWKKTVVCEGTRCKTIYD